MNIDRAWADTYFERGIDLKSRRIFLSDIEDQSSFDVVKALYFLDAIDSETPIELFICSPGGSVYHTFAIVDIINTIKAPVHTFAFGSCFSAAPLLLAVGEPGYRWVSENCRLMTHASSDEMSGKVSAMMSEVKETSYMDDKWNALIAERSNMPLRFWRSKSAKASDFYFSAQEAVTWGVADAIWVEK